MATITRYQDWEMIKKEIDLRQEMRAKDLAKCETVDQEIALKKVWAIEDQTEAIRNKHIPSPSYNSGYGGLGFLLGFGIGSMFD